MAVDPRLLELMPDTVIIKPWTGVRDTYGKPTYGNPYAVRARVTYVRRSLRTLENSEIQTNTTVILAEAPGVSVLDEITLPDGSKPPIVSVTRHSDAHGAHHETVVTA